MKQILAIIILLFASVTAYSQVPPSAVYPRFYESVPSATCTPGIRTTPLIVYRSDSPAGIYYCKTDGTWARVDTGALLSLNGLTATTQTFAVPTAADTAAWSSVTATHTLSLPITSVSGSSRTNFFPNFSAANTLAKTPYSWSGTTYLWQNTAQNNTFSMGFTPGGTSGDGFFSVGRSSGGSSDAYIQVDGINGELSISADSDISITTGGNISTSDLVVTGDVSATTVTIGGGTALTTSNQTGTGSLVLANTPTLVTPVLGVASATSITIGGGSTLSTSNQTGTGNLVLATSPTLVTPNVGAATATSINLGGATVTDILTNTASLNFDLTAVVSQDLTISVTGAALGDTCSIGVPHASVTADTIFTCWVSAADTVTVRALRMAGTPDPADGTFRVTLTKF